MSAKYSRVQNVFFRTLELQKTVARHVRLLFLFLPIRQLG